MNTAEQSKMGLRHDWSLAQVQALFALPFNDLLFQAQTLHRAYFDPNEVQVSTLLSIKTGACPEDCKYCPQSARYQTDLSAEQLLEVQEVIAKAREAKANGSTRFCMGAAWRNPKERDMPYLVAMIEGVRALGMETCMTLGMLTAQQAQTLSLAGLDYYNHNLDTSPDFYQQIITTRQYQDRLDTLEHVRRAGMKVCAGGIVGMGEAVQDRAGLLQALANLPSHPHSVPINMLVKVAGTPLAEQADLDEFEFIRTIAVARIMMPASYIRLSAGREKMNEQTQALCFLAGANSIFYGCKLLTTRNPDEKTDQDLFKRLGLYPSRLASQSAQSSDEVLWDKLASAASTPADSLFYDATVEDGKHRSYRS